MHHSELRIACALHRSPAAVIPLQTLIACRSPVASWRPSRRGGTGRASGRAPPALRWRLALSWRLWRRTRSRYELPCTHAQDRAQLLATLDASSDGLQLGFEVLGFGAVARVCGLNLRGEAAVLAGHHEGVFEAALVALDCEVQAGPLGVELVGALLYGAEALLYLGGIHREPGVTYLRVAEADRSQCGPGLGFHEVGF